MLYGYTNIANQSYIWINCNLVKAKNLTYWIRLYFIGY